MKRPVALALAAVAAGGALLIAPGTASAAGGARTTLTWSSEFNGANGSAPNPKQWTADVGGGGWGNGDLETYTTSRRNSVVQDGKLVITARKETVTGPDGVTRDYTSARLHTAGKFTTQYGRVEARIKVPSGAGLFPALWMMGDDYGSVGWPQCGEFDILENIGNFPRLVVGGLHGPGMTASSGSTHYTAPSPIAAAYHVYSMDWGPESVSWAFDGHVYATKTKADLPAGSPWVFDHPFFLLVNLAVGGSWPGTPPASTVFPKKLLVDWIRVYS